MKRYLMVRTCGGFFAPLWMIQDKTFFAGYSVAPDGVPYVKLKWVKG